MSTFRYTAVDGRGQPVSGELAAPSGDEALRQLQNYGMIHSVISQRESRAVVASLSADQAAELAGQVADLAKAGLPLPAGLRAMAQEFPRGRVSQAMRAIADQLDAGRSLEEAIQSYGARLPRPVRELIAAGHRSGRLAVVLEQFVELEQARAGLRRRLSTVLAYPTILLLLLLALHLFFATSIVPGFNAVYYDFGVKLPVMTQITLSFFSPAMNGQVVTAGVCLVLLFFLCTTGRPAWAQTVLYWIPGIGSVWRCNRLAEFSRLMGLMFDEQIPLPDALRWTAGGLSDADLAAACRKAADRVEAGSGFPECLVGLRSFPPAIVPLVTWGQYAPEPAEAMRAATAMFDERARNQADLLESFLSPMLFLVIVGVIGFVVAALFLPLIALISSLS